MRKQILLGIVLVGNGTGRLSSDLSADQYSGLLNEDFARELERQGKCIIVLTEKGRKIYNALDAVVATGTQW